MTTTPNLAMAYLVANQAQKEVTHNDALNDVDMLCQAAVLSSSVSVPPSSPQEGEPYIVAATGTGAWEGYDQTIASYYNGWRFKTPKEGWRVFDKGSNKLLYYTGSSWALLNAPYLEAIISWNPGSIANNAGLTSSAIAVTGALFGDFVTVAAPYPLQGLLATAYVSDDDEVQIRLHNATGADVTLASGTWKLRVQKG